MKLPNFLVAGFPKCGSTSLYYYLQEHPEVFLPKQKELHYFTYDIISEQKAGKGDVEIKKFHVGNLEDYQQCYVEVDNELAIGDVSPSYANYEEAIPKIKKTLGEQPKIVVTLRDPIQRAYSNYLHLVREERESLDFYDALIEEENRKSMGYADFWYYTFNSQYYEKIKRLKEHFENVYVITFEEFLQNPELGMRELFQFLEVDPDFVPENLHTKFNPGGVYRKNPVTRFIFSQNKLKTLVKKTVPITPGMKQLKLKTINKYKESTPPMDEKAEAFLVDKFKDEAVKLNRDFGVKTELWNSALK